MPDLTLQFFLQMFVILAACRAVGWIKWIGSHKDYDRIDVKEVDHGN